MQSTSPTEKEHERRLLMIGLPLSEPSQDDYRTWCEQHDLDTALLNSKGFLYELKSVLIRHKADASDQKCHLILYRLPAILLDREYVDRLHFLECIHGFFASLDKGNESLFARIEENELAFLIYGDEYQTVLLSLETYLKKRLSELLGHHASNTYQGAAYLLKTSDQYPLDVLANAREMYS